MNTSKIRSSFQLSTPRLGRREVIAVLCLFLSAVLFFIGQYHTRKGTTLLHSLTIESEREEFTVEWLQAALSASTQTDKDDGVEGGNSNFAAWGEHNQETISEPASGRNSQADVISIYGSSHCLLPYGKCLTQEDKQGCLIGKKLANALFGNCSVENREITWRDHTWIVRGVIKEPAQTVMVQVQEQMEGLHLNRINLSLNGDDRQLAGENFILQHSLSAHVMRYDYLYGLSWLPELIPGEWSDFDGWKQNLEKHHAAWALAKNAKKSSLEATSLDYQKEGLYQCGMGILLLVIGTILFLLRTFPSLPHWRS